MVAEEDAVKLVRLWEPEGHRTNVEAEPRFTAVAPSSEPERLSVTPCTVTTLGVIKRPPPITVTSAADSDSAAASTK